MVWSEYIQDAVHGVDVCEDECELEEENDTHYYQPYSVDDWSTYHSQDLLNMWFSLVQYREDSGLVHDILKTATYSDFCDFCYNFSRQ